MNIETELFYEQDKYIGFSGQVCVYKEEIFVDTRTGVGYDKVIEKLQPYINNIVRKYGFENVGFSVEDAKQHIIMRILEGIPKYDPQRNTTLSSFLYMRVERRVINEIRNMGAGIKNPTILKTTLYSVMCRCGNQTTVAVNNDDGLKYNECEDCGNTLENEKKYRINKQPMPLAEMVSKNIAYLTPDDLVSENSFYIPLVYGEKLELEDAAIAKCDFDKWMDGEDDQMRKLIELIYRDDYSIIKAAKEVGLSHMGAYNKLKQLKRKKRVRDMFNR